MQRSIYEHLILDTIAASGGDIVVKNRHLYIAGHPIPLFKFDDVDRDSIVKETAITSATAGVVTFTVGANPPNSAKYAIQLTQPNPSQTGAQNDPIIWNFAITTPATGTPTATTVADQFRALMAGNTDYFTASGTTTLIVTANTNFPVLVGSWVEEHSGTASTVAQTTQGVNKRGTPAAMALLGVGTNNTVWLNGQTTLGGSAYTLYYASTHADIGETNTLRANQGWQKCLWVLESATNYSDFITAMDRILAGTDAAAGTVANPDVIEVEG